MTYRRVKGGIQISEEVKGRNVVIAAPSEKSCR